MPDGGHFTSRILRIFYSGALAFALLSMAAAVSADDSSFLPQSPITVDSVLTQMNYFRGVHGLPSLHLDDRLTGAAQDRINDMYDQGYYSHLDPTGRSPFYWLQFHSYLHHHASENLAKGFETAQILVSAWMESPGHRANILSPLTPDVGIAIADGSPTGRSAGKVVVVMFGAEYPSSVTSAAR